VPTFGFHRRRCCTALTYLFPPCSDQTIWDTFDDLLLLVKGGKVAYAGKMGENSKLVMDYFSRLSGSEPPEQVNPADFAIAAVTSVSADEAAAAFIASTAYSDLIAVIKDAENLGVGGSNQQAHISCAVRRNNPFMEVMLLTKRHLVVEFRNPSYCLLRVVACCLVSLYLGLLFFGDKSDITGAVYTIGSLFFIVFVLVIPTQSSVVPGGHLGFILSVVLWTRPTPR
jgi:ATP-binding cassette, subfamily G (WHITE), member 2, PDR